jgi:hypothetical protein
MGLREFGLEGVEWIILVTIVHNDETCEYGNETSGSIKGGEFLEQLSDCQLLMKDSAPCG